MYRFYRNLYTDEGYLTFTLPVKKNDILLSKFLLSMSTVVAAFCVILIDAIISTLVCSIFKNDSSGGGSSIESEPTEFLYGIIVFLLVVFSIALAILVLFALISVFSRMSHRKRIVCTIVGFYGIGIIFTVFFVSILTSIGSNALTWNDIIPKSLHDTTTLLFLSAITVFIALLSIIVYTFDYYMIDKRLNLY